MLTLQIPGRGHDTLGVIAVGQDRNLAVGKDVPPPGISSITFEYDTTESDCLVCMVMHLQVCPLAGSPGNTPAGSGIAHCQGEDFTQVRISNFTKQSVLSIFMNKKNEEYVFFINVFIKE